MIPGEPLIDHQPPITPPGVRHPNPVHDFARDALIVLGIMFGVVIVVAWFWAVSPNDPCIPVEGRSPCEIVTIRPAG